LLSCIRSTASRSTSAISPECSERRGGGGGNQNFDQADHVQHAGPVVGPADDVQQRRGEVGRYVVAAQHEVQAEQCRAAIAIRERMDERHVQVDPGGRDGSATRGSVASSSRRVAVDNTFAAHTEKRALVARPT
jgi:hypothetical protein